MLAAVLFVFLDSSLVSERSPCEEFVRLQQNIRAEAIARDSAIAAFKAIIPKLDEYFARVNRGVSSRNEWRFPIEGYSPHAVGGNGKGYRAYGFDFFAKTKHNPHPAHDIFILDDNQDELDDETGAPARVVSVSSGVVVEVRTEWRDTSRSLGGKYVWIYDPSSKRIFYYAHLRSVFVELGECVVSGSPIGEVGRTGFHAAKRRSPTHLHLMVLQIGKDGLPKPINPYKEFWKWKRAPSKQNGASLSPAPPNRF
ncbi:MAG: M23 family metallopeptidase [Chloroherpetonaceae bacterium]|nr:M23 family metallopeptidase [Chloroherpetonaceae bacterium]